jgi:uncharacterized protein YjiS (DUF1127 family)
MPIGRTIALFEAHRERRRSPYLGRVAEMVGRYLAERRLRQVMIALDDKDDFVLLDLGIRRDQIEAVVRRGRFDLDPPQAGARRYL